MQPLAAHEILGHRRTVQLGPEDWVALVLYCLYQVTTPGETRRRLCHKNPELEIVRRVRQCDVGLTKGTLGPEQASWMGSAARFRS